MTFPLNKEIKIMASIFDIKPHVVNKDMRGYSVLLYGDPKSGWAKNYKF
jgi:hypothetical protein